MKPIEIAEQEEKANTDQDDWTDWPFLAELVEGIGKDLAGALGLSGAQCVNGHVNPESRNADPERSFGATIIEAIDAGDEEQKEDGKVNHAFAILLVVKSAQPGKKTEEER